MTEPTEAKNHWFQRYINKISSGIITDKEAAEKIFPCPCCGYPTLHERGGYEICELCFWEDDGQDDPRADEVWGGPNGRYSLTEARQNFRKYFVMYPPEKDTRIGAADSPAEIEAKKAIVAAFDAMESADNIEMVELARMVTNNWNVLRQESDRKVREHEQRIMDTNGETSEKKE